MKKRIAIFKHKELDYECITGNWADPDTWTGLDECPYIRLSEYVIVDFPDIIKPALDHASYDYE
jgi:hypothetical protein